MARAIRKKMPLIVLDGTAILPTMAIQLEFPRKSGLIDICEDAMKKNKNLFITNRTADKNDGTKLSSDTIYTTGIVTSVIAIYKNLPGDNVKVNVEGICRGEIINVDEESDNFIANVKYYKCDKDELSILEADYAELDKDKVNVLSEKAAMARLLKETYFKYAKGNPKMLRAMQRQFSNNRSLSDLIDLVATSLPISYDARLKILHEGDVKERFYILETELNKEIQINSIKTDLLENVKAKIEKNQREFVLREQLNVIKKELGQDTSDTEEENFKKAVKNLVASEEIKSRINKEIDRYSKISHDSSEGAVQRSYIETLLEMPYDKMKKESSDISKAEAILNKEHYGLEKVKERVLEFLSVRILTKKGDSPILCLVGPPGTGKTSIAKSIADSLNKEYVRISLGGVRDEAEIRGHRRTYVGAMPGRIAQGLKNAKVKNPLMLLDEIDKTSSDYKGDTSAALLEVLDSEQNSKFRDNYIDIPIDLSEVMFVATANDRNQIPRPLLDRMEVIELSGYTENEKFHIAKEHLIKKQFKANGLKASQLKITDDCLITIIQNYTKEAGVRGLERCIGRLCRKAAKMIVKEGRKSVRITADNLSTFLGTKKFYFDMANEKDEIGIVRGLAWTQVGGDTLEIEVNVMPGKGEVILTGQLGDVMKESATIGISYLRSVAKKYKISADIFKKNDFHIHIPQGSVPKDGPSAGITMATAIYSAITMKKVKASVAMTGEITLRGRVLPIGGLKEKLLAAKSAGIKTVLVPIKNKPDVDELSHEITDDIEIVYVETMEQVLRSAIV